MDAGPQGRARSRPDSTSPNLVHRHRPRHDGGRPSGPLMRGSPGYWIRFAPDLYLDLRQSDCAESPWPCPGLRHES